MAPTKNRKPQDAPQLLTVAEAARQLSLSRSTLYNLMDQGQLGYAKFGRARRIPQSEVARLIQASLIGGPEQFPAGFAGVTLKRQRKVYAVLRRALNLALKRGLVPRNVCLAVEMPKVELREMQPLTQEQAIRFLKAAEQDRLEAYYVLALMLGMRQGELIGLEWSDLDVSSGTLFVRRTLNESNGQFVAGPPKTKRGTRRIPLPRKVLTALEIHRERMQAEGHREIERVFCDSKGGPLRRQNVQRRSFKPLLKIAKCPAIRFHDLRHTYATLALANNVPLRVVADTLGHSRTSVTMDVYAHVLPTQARDAATAMDGLFG